MFNEGKEIVKYLEKNREQIRTLCYYPDDVLNCENLIKLMDYIFLLEAEVDSRTTLYNNAKELYLSTRNKIKQLEEGICLNIGDYINGDKITNITKDMFIKGQIDIFTDKTIVLDFGDREVVGYRIRKGDCNENSK